MTTETFRRLIPALKNHIWLNSAATAPLPLPVYEAMERHVRDVMEHGDLHYMQWLSFRESVHEHLARFIGAQRREVAFVPSTSFGFHVIAQMLKERGIHEVVSLETEFPSTTLPMLYDGLTMRGVRPRADGSYHVDDIEAALTPETGAVAVSIVQYASGFRINLLALAQLCRDRKLTLCLNAAQALGQIPIDVTSLDASFVAGTSHKWLMAGHGTGWMYIRKDWLESTRLPMGGWLSVKPEELFQTWASSQRQFDAAGFSARGLTTRRDADALEVGGASWVGLHGFDAALTMHDSLDVSKTQKHILSLQMYLRAKLRSLGFQPNSLDDPSTMSGICVVPVAGDALEVVRMLIHKARIVTTPRGGGVRISTHGFNTTDDIDALIHAFGELSIRPG